MADSGALQTLKMLIGINDNEKDDLLSFLLSDAENMILAYCRIEFVPRPLESLIPLIAADMYRVKDYGIADSTGKGDILPPPMRSIEAGASRSSTPTSTVSTS